MAVVEKDVGSGAMTLRALAATLDVGEDALGGDGLPVVAHGVPLDELEAELFGGSEDHGTARSVGWAEVVDGPADGVFECVVAGAELLADDA